VTDDVLVSGECSEDHCPSEVTDPTTGSTIFTSLEAMHLVARAAGWFVDDEVLACPNHVRRRRGHAIGTRFEKGRRDLGIRAVRWYDE
jgi:hypothetical protein